MHTRLLSMHIMLAVLSQVPIMILCTLQIFRTLRLRNGFYYAIKSAVILMTRLHPTLYYVLYYFYYSDVIHFLLVQVGLAIYIFYIKGAGQTHRT